MCSVALSGMSRAYARAGLGAAELQGGITKFYNAHAGCLSGCAPYTAKCSMGHPQKLMSPPSSACHLPVHQQMGFQKLHGLLLHPPELVLLKLRWAGMLCMLSLAAREGPKAVGWRASEPPAGVQLRSDGGAN